MRERPFARFAGALHMLRASDLYALTYDKPLTTTINNGTPVNVGRVHVRYVVRQVDDVSNLSLKRIYRLESTLRLVLPNAAAYSAAPGEALNYSNYPGLVQLSSALNSPDSYKALVDDYAPRSANASVSAAAYPNGLANSAISFQLGSAFSGHANTYQEAHGPRGSSSRSSADPYSLQSQGPGEEFGDPITNTYKDWAAYAFLDAEACSPSWIWHQESPWNIYQYRSSAISSSDGTLSVQLGNAPGSVPALPTASSDNVPEIVFLPPAVQAQLWWSDQTSGGSTSELCVAPPSQLAQLGLDLEVMARWRLEVPPGGPAPDLCVKHTISGLLASHGLFGSSGIYSLAAALGPMAFDQSTLTGPSIDLAVLGLDPIAASVEPASAAIGFGGAQSTAAFTYFEAPASGTPGGFRMLAPANNLLLDGQGFATPSPLQANFTSATTASLVVSFKVLDTTREYTLLLKNWVLNGTGCTLTVTVNSTVTLTREINHLQARGGDNDLLQLVLRSKNIASSEYHDFLQLGFNQVAISITPGSTAAPDTYVLAAIAVNAT